MKMCGIEFLFCLLFFLLAIYCWNRYCLGISFHVESCSFGVLCGASFLLFESGMADLAKYVKDRKSSAPADDNK